MIGGDPWAATAAGGDVWVAGHNDGTLTRIEGRTGRVLSHQAIAAKPASAIGAVKVGDRVWVGVAAYDKKGNDLAATRSADARTGKLGPLRLGPHDTALAFGAGGSAAYVGANYVARIPFDGGRSTTVKLGNAAVRRIGVVGNRVWVGLRDTSQPQPDQIVSFDASSLRRGATVPAAGPVTAVTSAAGSVWVASATAAGDSVVRLDPRSGRQLARIDAGEAPTAIAADGSGVWILDYFASAIKHIAARTNTVDQALTFAPAASTDLLPDNSPRGLAVLPGAVWVTVRDSTVAYRIPAGR
jgi:DNA-binding beta-propeller fold protein YncE